MKRETTFRGGIHPPDSKALSRDAAPVVYEAKGEMVFPVSQHIGKPAQVLVRKGGRVLTGQKIAAAGGFVSSDIHCSCSGTVKAVETRKTITGAVAECIVVDNDGQFRTVPEFGKAGPDILQKQL